MAQTLIKGVISPNSIVDIPLSFITIRDSMYNKIKLTTPDKPILSIFTHPPPHLYVFDNFVNFN